MLQPSTCGEGGGAGGLEGAEALGATRALTWPQAAFGIYSRCFLHCLPMATGGVSHLLQVLFGLFCSWTGTGQQVAEATCIFVQKALKWPKSLVAHVAIATCASAKRPLQARVRWHDASQVAWSLLPGPISPLANRLVPQKI